MQATELDTARNALIAGFKSGRCVGAAYTAAIAVPLAGVAQAAAAAARAAALHELMVAVFRALAPDLSSAELAALDDGAWALNPSVLAAFASDKPLAVVIGNVEKEGGDVNTGVGGSTAVVVAATAAGAQAGGAALVVVEQGVTTSPHYRATGRGGRGGMRIVARRRVNAAERDTALFLLRVLLSTRSGVGVAAVHHMLGPATKIRLGAEWPVSGAPHWSQGASEGPLKLLWAIARSAYEAGAAPGAAYATMVAASVESLLDTPAAGPAADAGIPTGADDVAGDAAASSGRSGGSGDGGVVAGGASASAAAGRHVNAAAAQRGSPPRVLHRRRTLDAAAVERAVPAASTPLTGSAAAARTPPGAAAAAAAPVPEAVSSHQRSHDDNESVQHRAAASRAFSADAAALVAAGDDEGARASIVSTHAAADEATVGAGTVDSITQLISTTLRGGGYGGGAVTLPNAAPSVPNECVSCSSITDLFGVLSGALAAGGATALPPTFDAACAAHAALVRDGVTQFLVARVTPPVSDTGYVYVTVSRDRKTGRLLHVDVGSTIQTLSERFTTRAADAKSGKRGDALARYFGKLGADGNTGVGVTTSYVAIDATSPQQRDAWWSTRGLELVLVAVAKRAGARPGVVQNVRLHTFDHQFLSSDDARAMGEWGLTSMGGQRETAGRPYAMAAVVAAACWWFAHPPPPPSPPAPHPLHMPAAQTHACRQRIRRRVPPAAGGGGARRLHERAHERAQDEAGQMAGQQARRRCVLGRVVHLRGTRAPRRCTRAAGCWGVGARARRTGCCRRRCAACPTGRRRRARGVWCVQLTAPSPAPPAPTYRRRVPGAAGQAGGGAGHLRAVDARQRRLRRRQGPAGEGHGR